MNQSSPTIPYGEYLAEEFAYDLYCGRDGGGGIAIRHIATGKVRHAAYSELGTGSKQFVMRNEMLTSLIAELKAEGIPPKPPKVGVKKIGKPRWSEKAKTDE